MRAGIVLVALSALLGLAGVELLARFLRHGHCQDVTPGVSLRSPFFGWGHVPGASRWAQSCLHDEIEWRTLVQTNTHGLADREIPYEPTAARRILVLGDSFAEGFQVAFGQRAHRRLERALNAPDPSGTHVEVVNAGVSGWGTDNALLYFLTEGWRYHPDVVMLLFNTGNDVFENDRRLVTSSKLYPDKPYFVLVDGRLVRQNYPLPAESSVERTARALYRSLEPHSALVRRLGAVSFVWRYLQSPPGLDPGLPRAHPWQVYLRDYPETWREAWRITRGLILRLRQAVEARGARFVVVVVNGREEVSPARMQTTVAFHPDLTAGVDPDKPHRLITRFLARRGIPTIELLDAFRAEFAANGQPGFFQWDIHWDATGHALAAIEMERGLVALGLLDASRRATSASAIDLPTRAHPVGVR